MTAPQSPTQGVTFELSALSEELRAEPAYQHSGHTARTLTRTEDLRVVLVALQAGKQLAEHQAKVTATVQALSGRVRLRLPSHTVELVAGQLLVLAAGLPLDVQALDDSLFLLTLGWAPKT